MAVVAGGVGPAAFQRRKRPGNGPGIRRAHPCAALSSMANRTPVYKARRCGRYSISARECASAGTSDESTESRRLLSDANVLSFSAKRARWQSGSDAGVWSAPAGRSGRQQIRGGWFQAGVLRAACVPNARRGNLAAVVARMTIEPIPAAHQFRVYGDAGGLLRDRSALDSADQCVGL